MKQKKDIDKEFFKYRAKINESLKRINFSFYSQKDTAGCGCRIEDVEIFLDNIPPLPTEKQIVGIDCETEGVGGDLHGIGLHFYKERRSFYIHTPRDLSKEHKEEIGTYLKKLSKECMLIQYTPYDTYVIARSFGIILEAEDLALLYYSLDAHNTFTKLSYLSREYLGRIPESYEEVLRRNEAESIFDIPVFEVASYCAEDCFEVSALYEILQQEARNKQVWDLYLREREIPVSLTVSKTVGIRIDSEYLQSVGAKLKEEREEILHNIKNSSPLSKEEEVHISKPDWLRNFLFKRCNLPEEGIRRTKSGALSVDKNTLENLETLSRIPGLILEWRKLHDLETKFLNSFYKKMEGERIYPNFQYTATITGRLSAKDPNIQQIPNPGKGDHFKAIRNLIIPEKGYCLISADYPSIELRILAFLSDCPFLKNIYVSGEDLHNKIACYVFNIDESEFSRKIDSHERCRRLAKTVNYGIVYGLTASRLKRVMISFGISNASEGKAEEILESYWNTIPEVSTFLARKKVEAFADGEVFTYQGRRRSVQASSTAHKNAKTIKRKVEAHLLSWEEAWEELAKFLNPGEVKIARQIGNYLIQAHNADSLRWAIAEYYRQLSDNKEFRLLFTVHDEIVIEVPEGKKEEGRLFLKRLMEKAIPLGSIPVNVEPSIGYRWGELK